MAPPELSIVIPFLNEEAVLPLLQKRLQDLGTHPDWELVFVSDGSTDSRRSVGEVRIRGTGEKLKAVGWAMHPIARTPFPAVLTVIEEQNSELTPISVDLMNQKGPPLPGRLDTEESFFWIGFSTYPLAGCRPSAPADRLLFFAIDPENHEAYPLRRTR